MTVHCDTACYLPTPGKYPAPVTSIMTCPLSCVTVRFVCGWGGLTAVTTHRITGRAVCHDPAKAVYTDGTPAC